MSVSEIGVSEIGTPKQKAELYLASSLYDGVEDNNLKQVTTLLSKKEADPNVLMPLHGITPFHLVIGNDSEVFAEEVTKLFLRYGGNPNVKSIDGMTPVHIAAAWGRTKILDLLLANGGDPLCLDSDSCTPFHYAFQGEHYEAVSILSKICVNEEDQDEVIKYKLELDKVLVNNGEVLAEYIVADHNSSLSTSYKSTSYSSHENQNYINETNGYAPENESTSVNSDFITVRKSRRKRLAKERASNVCNDDEKDHYDFTRGSVQEELDLLNDIISQLSNSLASETDAIDTTAQNHENECLVSCKTSSPKRMQMTMVFNRPAKCTNKYANLSNMPNLNRNSSSSKTLQIIKQHNNVLQLKDNRIANSSKRSSSITEQSQVSKKSSSSLTKKVTSSRSTPQTPVNEILLHSKYLDDTIISKSPNLHININSHERKKKLLKTPIFEKKASPRVGKKPAVVTTPCHSPSSRIPRAKKYFMTPNNLKTVRKNTITPTQVPKTKFNSLKKISDNEKYKYLSPLNITYNKSELSTQSHSSDVRSHSASERSKSLQDVSVNLTDRLHENEDQETSKETSSSKYDDTSAELGKLLDGSEFISGINVLDSAVTAKSCSKIGAVDTDEEAPVMRESAADLNQAILDSFSNAQSREMFSDLDNENRKNCEKSGFDSLVCQHGSVSSISSTSFLSLGTVDDASSDNKSNYSGANIHKEGAKPAVSNDESSSSSRRLDSESFFSVNEEYKYEDPEEGVVFLERRLCVSPSYASSDMNTSFYSISTAKSEPLPAEMFLLDSAALRNRLKNLGENPGPITSTTYHLYLKHLHKLESGYRKPIQKAQRNHNDPNSSNVQPRSPINSTRDIDLLRSSLLSIDWIHELDDYEALERKIFQEFVNPHPSRKWREGTAMSSFNYLLLDPRITRDLPRRAANLSMSEKWQTFLSAIFYVGKGKNSRPYAHLYDAFKIWVSGGRSRTENSKIQRILDIWNSGQGVVVLHVFHNTIPVEAYTREAAMIEVLGTNKLGNCKSGDYYGVVATWRSREKCELGRYLLYKAMHMLLLEGERQISPIHL